MKPSLLSTSSTLTRSREAGVETFDLLRICALKMRAIISPSGSFKAIARCSLPARLEKARDQALGAEVAQRDTAHLELAVVTLRPAGDLAPIMDARRRRVARQLGKLERRREAFFHRLVLVARNGFQLGTPLGVLLGHAPPPVVLLDRTRLSH